jgi:hypothetical protein
MQARSLEEDYQDLELATARDEEKGEDRQARATQTSPQPRFKKKVFLLLGALLAAYETFEPVEKGTHDFLGHFTPQTRLTEGVGIGIASLLAFIVMIATLRGMGKGLRHLEHYSDRQNAHSDQLIQLRNQIRTQATEIQQLRQNQTNLFERINGRQEAVPQSAGSDLDLSDEINNSPSISPRGTPSHQ